MERLTPEQLEKMVHDALRSLPDRRAPAALEARVWAALERRAAIPWWHRSWGYWPLGVRAAFVVFCGAVAAGLVLASLYVPAGFDSAPFHHVAAPVLGLIDGALGVGRWLAAFGALLVRQIPALWLYAALAFVAALYAMLFGLGATAYRTLWSHR
jgi:hypothetical protein